MNESRDAILAARAAINDAIARRDADGIGVYLLPECHVVTVRSMPRDGREQCVRGWSEMFTRDAAATHRSSPDDIHVNDEWGMAAENGRWSASLIANDGPMELAGVYAAKWQNTADGWRLRAEIFTPLSVERHDGPGRVATHA